SPRSETCQFRRLARRPDGRLSGRWGASTLPTLPAVPHAEDLDRAALQSVGQDVVVDDELANAFSCSASSHRRRDEQKPSAFFDVENDTQGGVDVVGGDVDGDLLEVSFRSLREDELHLVARIPSSFARTD